MKLNHKVVFITDADSKSGSALMQRLGEEGARFLLNSTSAGAAIQTELDLLRRNGHPVFVTNIDLCESKSVEAILTEAEPMIGSVDVLIHNTNVIQPALVETCEEATFLAVMNANAKSAFICTQEVGRQMAAKQSGKIVFVSSIHAAKPTGYSFAYSASKGAVQMLAHEAALELGRHNVNVNTIELGPIEDDEMPFQSEISPLYEDYRFKIPRAVCGRYQDLAELVLYLSTDDAAHVNGADIRLDGGFLLHYVDRKMKKE